MDDHLAIAGDKVLKRKSLIGVTRALNAGNPLDYRKIRCKGEEPASNATKTYSLGLAAEQVPVADEFGVECLENLQIIEDDNQTSPQSPEETIQPGAGRKAMSDWLLKYGDITGNANLSKKASASAGSFPMSANVFSQVVQEASSHHKIQSESPESDKPGSTNRPGKKAQSSRSEGRNSSHQTSGASSKSASSSQTKKSARPKKSLKKPEKGDGKRT